MHPYIDWSIKPVNRCVDCKCDDGCQTDIIIVDGVIKPGPGNKADPDAPFLLHNDFEGIKELDSK